jgi:hypothetical protein
LLVLPSAFIAGSVGESVSRLIFALLLEIPLSHRLPFSPGVEFLIWQLWAPLLFVACGVSMAPRFKFETFMGVGGLKIAVAAVNLSLGFVFVSHGGSWYALGSAAHSPLWWNSIVYAGCIVALIAFGLVFRRRTLETRVHGNSVADQPRAAETQADETADVNGVSAPVTMSAWNWLWFGPVAALILAPVEWHTVRDAFMLLQLWWHRWRWLAWVSPSAGFCLSAMFASVLLPIQGVLFATVLLFDPNSIAATSARRKTLTLLVLVAVLLLPLLTDALIWGSFPLTFERGAWRVRMIPFFPWPDRPYGDY